MSLTHSKMIHRIIFSYAWQLKNDPPDHFLICMATQKRSPGPFSHMHGIKKMESQMISHLAFYLLIFNLCLYELYLFRPLLRAL